ncbi:MAG: DJ-1/PfpI family protein [Anaerolineales bacterium]
MTRQVAIYLYHNVEVLDFAGPYEVFTTASRVFQRAHPQNAVPFAVNLIALQPGSVEARGGFRVLPDYLLSGCQQVDILLVPGGEVSGELEREELLSWIRDLSQSAEIIASVCTGSFILAAAGLLSGLRATTHWEDLDEFEGSFPDVEVVRDQRWVEEGKLMTSAGISAGIDMSLQIVSHLEGRDLADSTARQMDYRWQPHP